MQVEVIAQWSRIVLGTGALAAGLLGLSRTLMLQRLLMRRQAQGQDPKATQHDPEVRAALRGLRVPLIVAAVLAAGSVAGPSLVRMALG